MMLREGRPTVMLTVNKQTVMNKSVTIFNTMGRDTVSNVIIKKKSQGQQKKMGRDKHIANFNEAVWNNRLGQQE